MNLNLVNAFLAWLSIFAIAWLLIINKIPSNWTTWGFFIFFLLIALFAGVYSKR